jgi:hypothetical protein
MLHSSLRIIRIIHHRHRIAHSYSNTHVVEKVKIHRWIKIQSDQIAFDGLLKIRNFGFEGFLKLQILTERVGRARVVVRRVETTAASLNCILELEVGMRMVFVR